MRYLLLGLMLSGCVTAKAVRQDAYLLLSDVLDKAEDRSCQGIKELVKNAKEKVKDLGKKK